MEAAEHTTMRTAESQMWSQGVRVNKVLTAAVNCYCTVPSASPLLDLADSESSGGKLQAVSWPSCCWWSAAQASCSPRH